MSGSTAARPLTASDTQPVPSSHAGTQCLASRFPKPEPQPGMKTNLLWSWLTICLSWYQGIGSTGHQHHQVQPHGFAGVRPRGWGETTIWLVFRQEALRTHMMLVGQSAQAVWHGVLRLILFILFVTTININSGPNTHIFYFLNTLDPFLPDDFALVKQTLRLIVVYQSHFRGFPTSSLFRSSHNSPPHPYTHTYRTLTSHVSWITTIFLHLFYLPQEPWISPALVAKEHSEIKSPDFKPSSAVN